MKAEELRSLPLFAQLDDDALRELSVWLDEVKVSEGKHLVDEGDYAYDLFVIVEGSAEVTREGEPLAELGPGDFFGEMGVLSDEGRRNATVVAKSPMKLLTLASYDVDRMKKKAPEMLDRLKSAIEERSRAG
jgi:CRP/FNR family cyclic AMP-dependent transcriptional regulator